MVNALPMTDGRWRLGWLTDGLAVFDRHSSPLTRKPPVTLRYRTTQYVRRFLAAELGADIHLNRRFMAWIRTGAPKTVGDVADELARLRRGGGSITA